MGFAVHVLCYGDHSPLASRCLKSIVASADWSLIDTIRVGLNAVSDETRTFVLRMAETWPVPWEIFEPTENRNVGKYPLMRRMFYSGRTTMPKSPYVMWFDDDSFIRPGVKPAWWGNVLKRATTGGVDEHSLVGSQYQVGVNRNQQNAIKQQPWYCWRAEPISPVHFVQGGWWVASRPFLEKWDYPFPALYHNGGDVLLGELHRRQGKSLLNYNLGVASNADAKGQESKAKRRGLDTKPLWSETPFDPKAPVDIAHHEFECMVLYGGPTP